jgi:hypothetical protein
MKAGKHLAQLVEAKHIIKELKPRQQEITFL